MKKKPIINWDKETGITTCEVEDAEGRKFFGKAVCSPEDADYKSAFTGGTIAELRATINAFKAYRIDKRHELKALNQLYYSMNQSQYFNPKSYENIMLQRQIRLKKEDIKAATEQISLLQENLRKYIDEKDSFHKKMDKARKEKKHNS